MTKQRKVRKVQPPPVKRRPRINFLSVLYVVIAIAVVFSLVAGVFSGVAAPVATDGTTTGQTASRDTDIRIPITVVPAQPTAVPTP